MSELNTKNFIRTTHMVIRRPRLISEYDEVHKSEDNINKNKIHSNFTFYNKERKKPEIFPSLSEPELMRHYHRLARMNYSWDDGLYPLGSCTMKYNPILHEKISSIESFMNAHPEWPQDQVQGILQIIYETQSMLEDLLDIYAVSLQPAAGAHGELTGVFMIRKYFEINHLEKDTILIPDSAHGTNPASAMMGAYKSVEIKSGQDGTLDLEDLRSKINDKTAALMITNPNTMGVFEENIYEIKNILDKHHALLFMDGANLNAIAGRVSFKKMGVDLTQLNLHKTFSTPHGGGGPGQGAIGVSERMADLLPSPSIRMTLKDQKPWYEWFDTDQSIGSMKAFFGHFGVIVRAWAYLKMNTGKFREISGKAVQNSNYIKEGLHGILDRASEKPSMHEVVFNQKKLTEKGITTMNLAKSLLDRGFYAPTVYFPLNVTGAIMIEPTETESKDEMDYFIQSIKDIIDSTGDEKQKEKILNAPHHTPIRKIDEVGAARKPRLKW